MHQCPGCSTHEGFFSSLSKSRVEKLMRHKVSHRYGPGQAIFYEGTPALAVYCITIVKVFFFDLSYLDAVYRIISFAVLGVLLLFASLLYQRLSARIAAPASQDDMAARTARDS